MRAQRGAILRQAGRHAETVEGERGAHAAGSCHAMLTVHTRHCAPGHAHRTRDAEGRACAPGPSVSDNASVRVCQLSQTRHTQAGRRSGRRLTAGGQKLYSLLHLSINLKLLLRVNSTDFFEIVLAAVHATLDEEML